MTQTNSRAILLHESLPADISEATINNLATDIRALQREATLGFCLRVGRMIVEKLYGGEVDAWRSRGHKDQSFRKLTDMLPDMSASYLYRAVAIYDLEQRIGGVAASQHLGMSHVQVVLALPDKEQRRLLKSAEEKTWSVREIGDAAARVRKKLEPQSRGGRKPLPAFVKSLHQLRRYAEDEQLLLGDLESLEHIDATERGRLGKTIVALQAQLNELLKKIGQQD